MKLRLVFDSKLPTRFGATAITLYPYIFFAYSRDNVSQNLMKHELIHFYQIQKVGVLSFYISYLLYYCAGLMTYKNHRDAYLKIPYEEEAYRCEDRPFDKRDGETLDKAGYSVAEFKD